MTGSTVSLNGFVTPACAAGSLAVPLFMLVLGMGIYIIDILRISLAVLLSHAWSNFEGSYLGCINRRWLSILKRERIKVIIKPNIRAEPKKISSKQVHVIQCILHNSVRSACSCVPDSIIRSISLRYTSCERRVFWKFFRLRWGRAP